MNANNVFDRIFGRIAIGLSLLVTILIPAYYFRFSLFGIPTNLIEILVAIAVLCFIIANLREKQFKLSWSYGFQVILIVVGIAIGCLVSADRHAALGILKGWFIVPILFSCLVANNLRAQPKLVKSFQNCLFISLIGVSLYALLEWLKVIPLVSYQSADSSIVSYISQHRAIGFFESPNYLAMFIAPLLVFFITIFLKTSKTWKHWLALILPAGALVASGSRGGIVSAGVMIVTAFLITRDDIKRRFNMIVPIVVSASLIIFSFIAFNLSDSRREIWKVSFNALKHHFLFGIGPGQFQNYFETNKSLVTASVYASTYPYALHSHNIFLTMWLSGGLLAIAGLIYLIIKFIKLYRPTALAQASFLALMAIFLHGLVDTTYFKNDLAIIFWLLAVLLATGDRAHEPNQE